MPLIILLPILGVVLLLRRLGRLTDSMAILNAVSALILLLYIGALLGFMRHTAFSLTGIGLLLLIYELRNLKRLGEFPLTTPILLFIFIPVIYWLIHSESRPLFWDEYSHWGIYIQEMVSTHQLWTIETNAAHPDYPPGNALWQYFFTLIPGYNEGIVYLAQFVLLITPLLVLFENICRKQLLWIPAIMALLALGLSNFGHGIVSLYADHIIGVWYAGILLQGLQSHPGHPKVMGLLSMPLAVLLLIKDAGIPLVASAMAFLFLLLAYRHLREKGWILPKRTLILVILVLVGLPLLVHFSWQLNRKSVGVMASGEGTGIIKILLTEKSKFTNQELQTYRDHLLDVIVDQQLSKDSIMQENYNEYSYRLKRLYTDTFRITPLVFFIMYVLLSIVLITNQSSEVRIEIIILLLVGMVTLIIYSGIIYLTYPLLYSADHALNLKSFLRYFHTIILPLFIVGMGLLTPAFHRDLHIEVLGSPISLSALFFGVGMFLLYTFEPPYLRPFYTPAIFEQYPRNIALRWRQDTEILTEKVRDQTGMKRLWVHLPLQDNGSNYLYNHSFMATVIRYQMTPTPTSVERSPNFMERPTGEIVEIWKNFNFLWFPVLDDSKTSKLFEEKFGIPMAMHRVSRVEKFEDRIKLFSAVK